MFIQKDFDFQKLLDVEDWGFFEQYMLLAPLSAQLVQVAFILEAILIWFLYDVRALDKDSITTLWVFLQMGVVVVFFGGNIATFIMALIWKIFLDLSLEVTAYFWFIPFLKDPINLLTKVVPLLGLTLTSRDPWEVVVKWSLETMTVAFNLAESVQWQYPTSWQFWVLFSVLVLVFGIPSAAVVSIVRIIASIFLICSEPWYMISEPDKNGGVIVWLTSLIVLLNIPASIAFLFTGLPLILEALGDTHLSEALVAMAAVIGGVELLLNDIPL